MEMHYYWLTLGVLAVWRISHLLNAEDGPWDSMARLRQYAGQSLLGRALDCFYCLSLWVALPVAWLVALSMLEFILLWPAMSGGAILLQRLLDRNPPPAQFEEDKPGD
ncbi:MAG: DUF1360 domain-containing protein [Aestuariivirga sp.]